MYFWGILQWIGALGFVSPSYQVILEQARHNREIKYLLTYPISHHKIRIHNAGLLSYPSPSRATGPEERYLDQGSPLEAALILPLLCPVDLSSSTRIST